ncbi:MAG: DUF4190 domain-containing protein [Candidatus Omnitrophica bacterium]|nr:DUF4190 domain-containing protein [Candidatus Omnitrophota bacterium]
MTEQQKTTVGFAVASFILGLFFLIPLLGTLLGILAIIFGIIALSQISKNKETLKGGWMAVTGIVLGALSVLIVPILGLLAAIAIPNMLRARMMSNDALAKSNLRTLSAAAEIYKTEYQLYPASKGALLTEGNSTLKQSYCDQTYSGFIYTCEFSNTGYRFKATPEVPGSSGSKIFTIVNGGMIVEEEPVIPYD